MYINSNINYFYSPNVCIEREETTEDEKKEDELKDDAEGISFLSHINLSSCHETADKYECTTR